MGLNSKEKFEVKTNPKVEEVFNNYPELIRIRMLALRDLVIETARDINDLEELQETLKWGEPSYLAKNGSTLRIDWKSKVPDQYAMYFKCTSRLVETFITCSIKKDNEIERIVDPKEKNPYDYPYLHA